MNVAVSAVLVMSFSIIIVGVVLQFGLPLIEEKELELNFETGKSTVEYLSILINEISSEPINSSVNTTIQLKSGRIQIKENQIIYLIGLERYEKQFSNIKLNSLEIPEGKAELIITKIAKGEVKISLY